MKTTYRISLDDLTHNTDQITNILFTNCENLENVVEGYEFVQMTLSVYSDGQFSATCVRADSTTFSFTNVDYDEYIIATLIMDADVGGNNVNKVLTLIQNQFIDVNQKGKTTLLAFIQNSENDHLSKTLTGAKIFDGNFKNPVNVKTIEIDVDNYGRFNKFYNYIFIPILNRFYYVRTATHTTKDFTRLYLSEDVLMSWRSLIKSQDALVTRQQNEMSVYLVDNRRPLKDILSTEVITPIDTPYAQSKVNVYFNLNLDDTLANFLIVGRGNSGTDKDFDDIKVIENPINPSNPQYLPNIQPHTITTLNIYFIPFSVLKGISSALMKDDSVASYLDTLLWLPFDPRTPFNLDTNIPTSHPNDNINLGGKWYDHNLEEFRDATETIPPCPYYFKDRNGKFFEHCPYLVAFDGTFSTLTSDWRNYEPYSNYEINVPFVGLVKVQSKDIINKRILIYYSMDLRSGSATAYMYNYTDNVLIWSGACQLGVVIPVNTTNNLENTKQKQSNDLNMILGMISSVTSVGIGVASDNPIAIVGGVLSASKTVATYVNANRMIFERCQVMYNGSGEGMLYAPIKVYAKRTYNETITIDLTTYAKMQGYPSNKYESLSTLTGYTEIGEIHFNPKGNEIYQDEIVEIIALLKSGVIL